MKRLEDISGTVIHVNDSDTVETVMERFKEAVEKTRQEVIEHKETVTLDEMHRFIDGNETDICIDWIPFVEQFGMEAEKAVGSHVWLSDLVYDSLVYDALTRDVPGITDDQMKRMMDHANRYAEGDLLEEVSILCELACIVRGDAVE